MEAGRQEVRLLSRAQPLIEVLHVFVRRQIDGIGNGDKDLLKLLQQLIAATIEAMRSGRGRAMSWLGC